MSERPDPGQPRTEGVPDPDRSAEGRGAPGELMPGLLAPSEEERTASARARGLSAPYIAGGRDPDPESGRREERFYGRLLIAMVATIVLGGFLLGIIATVLTLNGGG